MTFSKVIELFVCKLSWSLAFENVNLKQANSSASELTPQAARKSPNKAKNVKLPFYSPKYEIYLYQLGRGTDLGNVYSSIHK